MKCRISKPVLMRCLPWATALFAVLLLMPQSLSVHAQSPVDCEKFSTDYAKFVEDFDARIQSMQQERATRQEERAARQAEMEGNRADREAESRAKMSERLAALNEKAETPAQEEAIAAFTATVEAAIAARTVAIEAAVNTFRSGADEIAGSAMVQADAAGNSFREAVSAAFSEALAACEAGSSPKEIGSTLREKIQAAKAVFEAARNSLPDVKAEVENSLRPALESAVARAIDTFKTTVEEAAEKLKAAFGTE